MGRITSNIGLVTGIAITDTIDQLMALAAKPRDSLVSRTQSLSQQQSAIGEITAAVLSLQFSANNLGNTDYFTAKKVASSDSSQLSATITGDPPAGSFQYTPLRVAQTHQSISSPVGSADDLLGAGSLTLGFGGEVNHGIHLTQLNGGEGIERGQIRITDRSGASATIDLRFAQTVDDIIEAISDNQDINVTASARGDAIHLTDNTGQTTSNLKVQEVGTTETATSLGLAGIDAASDDATGSDVLRLFDKLSIDALRDNIGLSIRGALPDLAVTFRDGTSLQVDLNQIGREADFASDVTVAANGNDAGVQITADTEGGEYDSVRVQFISSGGVSKGSETVVYDDSDPANKTLTFDIELGQTDANDILDTLNNDPTLKDLFTAARASGGAGTGLITLTDTAVLLGGAELAAKEEATLGDLLQTINATDPTRLKAQISADGDHIEFIDLTTDTGGTFQVSSPLAGSLAEELGLTGSAVGGVLTSSQVLGGLKTSLLSSLDGGTGLGTLGVVSLTDRSGATANVDLSAATTLDDVLQAFNQSGLGITASINSTRNGIVLRDTTGSSASNFIVANGDGTNSADLLGIAIDDAIATSDSGTLRLQSVSKNTTLESLNGGVGIALGSFVIQDTNGAKATIELNQFNAVTIGDVIDLINAESIGIEARINDSGNGILLADTASGSQTLSVSEVGFGRAARDLHLLGESKEVDLGSGPVQVIDGAFQSTIEVSDTDTLNTLVKSINATAVGVRASIVFDGVSSRLNLTSEVSGAKGALLLDASSLGLSFEEVARAQDALLLIGSPESSGAGILTTSTTNLFNDILPGVSLAIGEASQSPVTINVSTTDDSLLSSARSLVTQFNNLQDKIEKHNFYNAESNKGGVLRGSGVTLRIETSLSRLFSGRFFGVGKFQALESLGIGFKDDGRLKLDESKLQSQFAADPDAVTEFFTDETVGFSKKVSDLAEDFAGEDVSLLINRIDSLQRKIDLNANRILFLNERLEKQRERMFIDFIQMETTIGKIRNNLSAIDSIQALPPL